MKQTQIITKHDQITELNGKPVCISGKYVKYNPLPKTEAGYVLYLSGILLEGDTIPKVFLEHPRSDSEQKKFNGKNVEVSGIFYDEQPTRPGDPEHASKFRGSWIYNVDSIKVIKESL